MTRNNGRRGVNDHVSKRRNISLQHDQDANQGDRRRRVGKHGVIVDSREPDVIRVAPTPLYNSFHDVHRFVHRLKEVLAVMDKK